MALPEPQFINTDADQILAECVASYEELTGMKLSPGQAEMLLINAFAYREQLVRIAGNEAAKQNLLSFARYPMLDYLGELVGVTRLPASKAECTLRFNLVDGHGSLVLPSGLRVQSIDGKAVFITLEEKAALSTDTFITVKAQADVEGSAGNKYAIGDVSIILDPRPYISSAANTDVTGGGADEENDDELRERIRLAPSGFSCAGPRGAYEYFAKSAHPAIIDIGITSPIPGQVNIYPLLENAETPSAEIIDAVFAKVNDDKIRPLTDTVIVEAPSKVEYEIVVNLTLLTGAITSATVEQVRDNLEAYATDRKNRLGVDAMITDIIAESRIKGSVYRVEVVEPAEDQVADFSQVAFCTDITINVVGYSDE